MRTLYEMMSHIKVPSDYSLVVLSADSVCAGPLKYSPSLLFPISAMLSTFGAVHGHKWVLLGLSLIPQQAQNIPHV